MARKITFVIMLLLAGWVTFVAIRIELLNAAAGYYLPVKQPDGKWRISPFNTPRDQLREVIYSMGLVQYPLALALIALSVFQFVGNNDLPSRRKIALVSCIIGITAFSLASYRGYLPSLGI